MFARNGKSGVNWPQPSKYFEDSAQVVTSKEILNSMKKSNKKNLGDHLIDGLSEILNFERGQINLRTRFIHFKDLPDWSPQKVQQLRKKLRMSQSYFAICLGVSAGAVKAWEQGLKEPSGAARRLLQIFSEAPETLKKIVANE